MRRLLALLALLALTGCFEEKKTGPVDIKWGREVCEQCGMIIDNPRFAAEVRGGADRKIHKFDDMGDAVLWLAKQSWAADPAAEIWVGDMDSGAWIDGRKAFYVRVKVSPMGHGFGATPQPREGAIGFEEMRKAVLAKGNPELCNLPDAKDEGGHAHDHGGAK
jgi:nitrous oxide reductase accessory protein NosL